MNKYCSHPHKFISVFRLIKLFRLQKLKKNQLNDIKNKFLLAEDTFKPKLPLAQPDLCVVYDIHLLNIN